MKIGNHTCGINEIRIINRIYSKVSDRYNNTEYKDYDTVLSIISDQITICEFHLDNNELYVVSKINGLKCLLTDVLLSGYLEKMFNENIGNEENNLYIKDVPLETGDQNFFCIESLFWIYQKLKIKKDKLMFLLL